MLHIFIMPSGDKYSTMIHAKRQTKKIVLPVALLISTFNPTTNEIKTNKRKNKIILLTILSVNYAQLYHNTSLRRPHSIIGETSIHLLTMLFIGMFFAINLTFFDCQNNFFY